MKYEIFRQEELQEIHGATLRVLERTGVKVLSEKVRQFLVDAGCRVSHDTTVHFPSTLVEECLRTVPKGFSFSFVMTMGRTNSSVSLRM